MGAAKSSKEKEGDSKKAKSSPSIRWRMMKFGIKLVAVLFIVPIILMLLYIPSFMHPPSTLMAIEYVQGHKVERKWVPLENVSPHVYRSVIMSEDGQFCSHHGIDLAEFYHVIKRAAQGKGLRGASTITMQTVKNMVLWPGRSFVAFLRKAFELPLSPIADLIWSKKRIMELYLNVAEWGPGIYGIEAAAQHYYKRSAKRLTARQAAYLTVALPNPILRNPRKPSRRMKILARIIERRAKKSGAYVKCLTK